MRVLGIETSCDETAVALVRGGCLVAERLASQVDVHALFGGVVPELASREHLRLMQPLARRLLDECGVEPGELDGIAVARGPGLLGALLVGLNFAKGLALATGAPLVGVNHCHAHLLAAGLEREIPFPALGLLVSGGHTQLYRMDSPLELVLLGRTLDDAAGEAFDKVAKLLNLPYPGGLLLDLLGREGDVDASRFPRPYLDNDNLDFSFSGLKTAVAQDLAAHSGLGLARMPLDAGTDIEAWGLGAEQRRGLADLAASFGSAVAETLAVKTRRAAKRVPDARSLVVAGGVAANSMLRAAMAELAVEVGLELILPPPKLCTDNAAMIAYAGEILLGEGLTHDLALEAVPRGRAVPWDYRRLGNWPKAFG